MAADSTNQSVERAMSVLATFYGGTPMRAADVAAQSGLGQSTTSRLLATLETLEFVERDAVSGTYRLGPGAISLGGAALNAHPIHRHARSVAQHLAGQLGLGANVAIRQSADLFYLCNFEGRLAPKPYTLTGQRNPLHATALGKCLLLGTTPEQRRSLLGDLRRFTASTVESHEALDEALEQVRARGYSTEQEELAFGRACLAAPILGPGGDVIAGLSVSGPLSAIQLPERQEELSRAVIEAADTISGELGYLGPGTLRHPVNDPMAGSLT